MLLAKVTGNVVATQKNPYLKGHKLLITQKIDLEGNFADKKDVIALDFVDSGIGDIVLVVQEGQAVKQILGHGKAPVHSVIVAVVDKIDIKK